jgi:uncharacterized protein YuzB (UPF0349 family)
MATMNEGLEAMQRGWDEAKNELATDTAINCVNPSPADNLNSVRLSVHSLREITHIENHVMREQAEELIEEVSSYLAEMQKQPGDNSQAVNEGFAFVRHIREMITAFNFVKLVVHCDICKSSFLGMGPTGDAAMGEASESLASHAAKYHPVQQ